MACFAESVFVFHSYSHECCLVLTTLTTSILTSTFTSLIIIAIRVDFITAIITSSTFTYFYSCSYIDMKVVPFKPLGVDTQGYTPT